MILVAIASELEYRQLPSFEDDTVHSAVVGVGKAASAAATTRLIQELSPKLVVSAGIGGYLGLRLRIGDIAVVVDDFLADEGVYGPGGFFHFDTLGFMQCRWQTSLSTAGIPLPVEPFRVEFCRGATVSSTTGCQDLARKRYGDWDGGVCESMEGAAIAQACAAAGVPWIGVRAISNYLEDRDMSRWDIPIAMESLGSYLPQCLAFFQASQCR
ncbi:futalosine hydrolase [Desulfurispira natronophila]|uniref:Futalosine hydrolase n=1 Tax=Desulfurispira natronophila TaxID=682562 RepID=A0A7W8DH12_9BACT|nr:futalosine hydrolase [Desulfurispira natronophila]